MIPQIELLGALAWLLGAFLFAGRIRSGALLPRWLAKQAGRRCRAVAAVGTFGVAAGAVASMLRWPEPRVHDEFSYLLAADTFAGGRLSNPTHPLWEFFETFHVNPVPTYASMYPPAQGAALALGQAVFGWPIAGVWISFGLACAAVCWMLQAWLPPRWAFLGGLLAVVRLGSLAGSGDMQGYWAQSYWGGAVAMLGGALVFGALPRLVQRPGPGYAVFFAAGLAVLANSRPFEGCIVGAAAGAAALVGLLSAARPSWKRLAWGVALPAGFVLSATLVGMAYYNARVTGSPTRFPYEQNGQLYGLVPLFLWQPLRPGSRFHHALMQEYAEKWAEPKYKEMRTLPGYAKEVLRRVRVFFDFYCGPFLLIPFLAYFRGWRGLSFRNPGAPPAVRSGVSRPGSALETRGRASFGAPLAACAVLAAALLVTTWFQPHYTAPVASVMILLIVQGLRRLRSWRWAGRPTGRLLVATLPALYLGLFACCLYARAAGGMDSWHLERARLLERLEAEGERHLVIVRYAADHSPHEEWVYNRADIDGAKVVWARDMGSDADRVLVDYFHNRRIWLLDADTRPARLTAYRR